MSSITNRLNTVVTTAEADAQKFHQVVHGDKTTEVTTEGGNVDSVAKTISDIKKSATLIPGPKGTDGKDGVGQDGLGQYIRYKLENDGTTPNSDNIATPTIDDDGALGAVKEWIDTIPTPEANRTLWVAIGHGKPGEAVDWSGAYPIQKGDKGETGKQGERGVTGVGTPGADGLGQYVLYANVADGTTPDHTAAATPTIGADGVLPTVTDWSDTIPSPAANTKLWALVGYGTAGKAVNWVSVFQAGLKGEKGDWGDGNGYYVYFKYCEEGQPCTKPLQEPINAKGVLDVPTGWKETPEEAAVVLAGELSVSTVGFTVPNNYVLWFLFGSGKARSKVRWISIFPTRGQKGEKGATGLPGSAVAKGDVGPQGPKGPTGPAGRNGTNGRDGQDGTDGTNGRDGQDGTDGNDGQDGLSQFRFYGIFDDSPTPSKPNRETIGSDGSLLPPTSDWKSTLPNPVANKTQWVLIGRGKPSTAVFWTGVYKVGDKGDKGDDGTIGKDGTAGRDGVGLPGLRGLAGTVGTDGLSQMQFYYAIDDSNYELLIPRTREQINANGVLSQPPLVRVKTLADDSVSDLSDSWSTSVPDKAAGRILYTLVGYGKPNVAIDWAGVYKAEGKDGAKGDVGETGKTGAKGLDGVGASLTDGSVTTDKLADDAVTTDKIDYDAVTTHKIAFKAVTNDKIGYQAVASDEILDHTITNQDLDRNGVSMLEPYKDPLQHPNIILQESGNVVYHLRFYGRVDFDFDNSSTIGEVLPANLNPRGNVKDNLSSFFPSSPAQGQQGQRAKRQSRFTDIPNNQAKMPHNKDYVLINNERIFTFDESLNKVVSDSSPSKEGWGRKPLLRPDQSGHIVVLEGVARKGDYITWTRTYLYNKRDIHRKDIIPSELQEVIHQKEITVPVKFIPPKSSIHFTNEPRYVRRFNKLGCVEYKLFFYGIVNVDFNDDNTVEAVEKKVLDANRLPRENHEGNTDLKRNLEKYDFSLRTAPAKGQQGTGKRRDKRRDTVSDEGTRQAQMPNDFDYVLLEDYQLWTMETGVDPITVTSPEEEGWGTSPKAWDSNPRDSVHHTPIVMVLEGVARMGDYVKWLRVYPYKDRFDYQGLVSKHLLPNSVVAYDNLDIDLKTRIRGSSRGGNYGLLEGEVITSKIADLAVTKSKLASDVLTVARADTYEEHAYGKEDYNNTFLSAENGKANTTGYSNTASGAGALVANTTGDFNTASGAGALVANTTGDFNTASGAGALVANTTGDFNTASGASALSYNTTGFSNTASGRSALFYNTTGSYNTASGRSALLSNTTGSENTASGTSALFYNTIGSYNTASGRSALFYNTTGSSNTASGYRALAANSTGDSNIGIGSGVGTPSYATSNYINIGNVLRGNLRTGNLTLTGTLTQNSDERLKENIADVQDGLDCVKKLRPVKYTRKEIPDPVFEKDKDGHDIIPDPAPQGGQRGSSEVEHGLIAQEVEKVCPDLVGTSEYSEGYKSVDYSRLSVVLLKAVQEQQEQIETLKGENQTLKKRIVALEAQ